jgi:myo-inositol-1-phosphate synthase
MVKSVGVLFVGAMGATASTTMAGAMLMARGWASEEYGVTDSESFESLSLPGVSDMRFGGWDLVSGNLGSAVRANGVVTIPAEAATALEEVEFWPGLRTSLDIPTEEAHADSPVFATCADAVEAVADRIRRFRRGLSLGEVVVVYTASPPSLSQDAPKNLAVDELLALKGTDYEAQVPSAVAYALGAVEAGAHFVDFTPSPTLEFRAVHELAERRGVRLAGRDGSTGQTMLKLTMGEVFKRRSLRVKSWYSTNVLGNHDGLILQLNGHRELKMSDKMDGLAALLGYDDFDHHVTIDYVPHFGDNKESWDAISLKGWLGSRAELRINWRGQDSFLAAPLLLDLIRLIATSGPKDYVGLQEHLGFFFKRPLGRQGVELSRLFDELVAHYLGPQD